MSISQKPMDSMNSNKNPNRIFKKNLTSPFCWKSRLNITETFLNKTNVENHSSQISRIISFKYLGQYNTIIFIDKEISGTKLESYIWIHFCI